jgi:diaminopimelate epimerase
MSVSAVETAANVATVGPDVVVLTTSCGVGLCAAAVVATSTAHIAKPR